MAVGVDVGGTKILSGLVGGDGVVHAIDRRDTPADGRELVDTIMRAVEALCDGGDCASTPVGCGFPALVTRAGVTRYGPNIGLTEFPLREQLMTRLGSPHVAVDNDASAATWAEFKVGAGRDVRDTMALFTLGTGVGGGLIIAGQLHRGANGFAGELGHMVLQAGGQAGPSGVDGELEAYSSGTAMERMASQARADGRFVGTVLDGDTTPTGEEVTKAAMNGVQPAVDILATMGRYLGIGCAVVVNAVDPELIVIGGGAAAAGDLILQPAREALGQHILGRRYRPEVPIIAAQLGNQAGMVGAALLALERREG